MDNIVLATDGSDYAREAATRAIEMATGENATLHVVCVVDRRRFDEPALSSAELATIFAEDQATMSVSEVTDMARGTDVQITSHTVHGLPHEEIVDYARHIGADTIVIGEHGAHEAHFSGVGRKVRDEADCDVIVVDAPLRQ